MEWRLKSEYRKMNKVFYAETYHPIQAGSIDGTDTTPHDNAVCRALLCSSASLYDPLGDPKLIGYPYCTLFVARLSHFTSEDSLRNAMSKYGRIKNLRIVRDIVTGASRGYAFVEYETEREMRRAYKDAHHSLIDDSEILVDYSRQQLMPGWIPRRLGGGLGGRKESGQLRFGGRERPFQAPLKPPPLDELKRLGIPPPPEGRYMPRFQVPSPPRRKRSSMDREESSRRSGSLEREDIYSRRSAMDREEHSRKRHSVEREEHCNREESNHRSRKRISQERNDHYHRGSFDDRENEHGRHHHRSSYKDRENDHDRRNTLDREGHSRERSGDTERHSSRNSSRDQEESSHKHRSYCRSDKRERRKPPTQDSAND